MSTFCLPFNVENVSKAVEDIKSIYMVDEAKAQANLKDAILKNPIKFGITNDTSEKDVEASLSSDRFKDLAKDDDIARYFRENGFQYSADAYNGNVKWIIRSQKTFDRIKGALERLKNDGYIDDNGNVIKPLDDNSMAIINKYFKYGDRSKRNRFIEVFVDGKLKQKLMIPSLELNEAKEDAEAKADEELKTLNEKIEDVRTSNEFESDEERQAVIAGLIQDAQIYTTFSKGVKTSAQIKTLNDIFVDGNKLQALGSTVSRVFSMLLTKVLNNPQNCEIFGIKYGTTRQEALKNNELITKILLKVKKILKSQSEKVSDPTAKRELMAAYENFGGLLRLCGDDLIKNEGIVVDENGAVTKVVNPNSISDMEQEEQSNTDDEKSTDDEQPNTDGFNVSDNNKSILSKIDVSVKNVLSQLHKYKTNDATKQNEKVFDECGWMMPQFGDVNVEINTILGLTADCLTESAFLETLKKYSESIPWIGELLDYIDYTANTTPSTIRRKEQLLHCFYSSFRKEYYLYDISYRDKNGFFKRRDLSKSGRVSTEYPKIRRAFQRLGASAKYNEPLSFISKKKGKDGNYIYSANLNHPEFKRIAAMAQKLWGDIASKAARGQYTIEYALDPTEGNVPERLQEVLRYLGINITNEEAQTLALLDVNRKANTGRLLLFDVFENLIDTNNKKKRGIFGFFEGRSKRILDLANAADIDIKDIDFSFLENPLDEQVGSYVSLGTIYKNLLSNIYKYCPGSRESSVYAIGKAFYCWNNPSSIQTMVRKLKGKGATEEEFLSYIREKYGKDSWFFMDKDNMDNPIFFSSWMQRLVSSKEARNVLEYSEKLADDGTGYMKIDDLSYYLAMLGDYYDGTDTGWYRMPIASDKPHWGSIKFYKNSFDWNLRQFDPQYATLTEEQKLKEKEKDFREVAAKENFNLFKQELKRVRSVFNDAISGHQDKIDNYSIKTNTKQYDNIVKRHLHGERVTIDDVVEVVDTTIYEKGKEPSELRYAFRNTGADFFFSPFIIEEIENETDFGKRVVDLIFNEQDADLTIDDAAKLREAFLKYMDNMLKESYEAFKKYGAFDVSYVREDGNRLTKTNKNIVKSVQQRHKNLYDLREVDGNYEFIEPVRDYVTEFGDKVDRRDVTLLRERNMFMRDVEEYIYNNYIAKTSMIQMFNVDPAYYKNTVNFQKRNSQIVSAGIQYNPEATFDGRRVSKDGKLRSMTIASLKVTSEAVENIRVALQNRADEIQDPNEKKALEDQISYIVSQFEKTITGKGGVDVTDGQAFTSITGARKKLISLGQWTSSLNPEDDLNTENPVFTNEAVYQRMKSGKPLARDFQHIFSQPFKNFVYIWEQKEWGTGKDGQPIYKTVPVQYKNSEYVICNLMAFVQKMAPNSQLAAISRFLEDTEATSPGAGIDTINFDSAVKIGNSMVLDINGKTPAETYDMLMNYAYDGDKYSAYVHEYDMTDCKQQQIIHEDFVDNKQKQGSQQRIIAVGGIKDDATIKLRQQDGKVVTMTGAELKARYFRLLSQKSSIATEKLLAKFGVAKNADEGTRKQVLSEILMSAMGQNTRYSADLKHGLSVIGNDFILPLDDFSQSENIESLVLSIVRNQYYNQGVPGGPVVQCAAWGVNGKYNIRYYKKNSSDSNELLLTKTEFEKSDIKNELNESGKKKYKNYQDYCKKEQGDLAWYECAIPMPKHVRRMLINEYTGEIDSKYINDDGTYNMDEIRKKCNNPEMFDAIGYRIPTEAKYSTFNLKVVDFMPEAGGSAIILPQEITTITGTDFDIDKTFVMMKSFDKDGNTISWKKKSHDKTEAIDNKLLDLERAAWSSTESVSEVLSPGDFSDLSIMSKKNVLIKSGIFKLSAINKMSDEEIAMYCERLEDHSLLSPVTDVLLHRQNSQSKEIIGMAAVSNITHIMMTIHNSSVRPEDRIFFNPKRHVEFIEDNPEFLNKQTPKSIDLTEVDPYYDAYGRPINLQLGKYIGASADAAKDAALYRFGITPVSFPIVEYLMRSGVSKETALAFINQPIIQRALDLYEREKVSNPKYTLSKAITKLEYSIYPKDDSVYGPERKANEANRRKLIKLQIDSAREKGFIFKYTDLIDGLTADAYNLNPNRGYNDFYSQLEALRELSSYEQSLRDLGTFLRYNSSTAATQKTMASYVEKQRRMNEFVKRQSDAIANGSPIFYNIFIPGTDRLVFERTFKYIDNIISGQRKLVGRVIKENMKSYGKGFDEILNKIAKLSPVRLDENDIDAIHSDYKLFLMTRSFTGPNGESMPPIIDLSNEADRKFYTEGFADHYEKVLASVENEDHGEYLRYIKDNPFIDAIMINDGYLSTNVNGLDGTERQKIINGWANMVSSKNKDIKKLAVDIAKYFFFRGNGLKYGYNSPLHLLPLRVKLEMPHYVDYQRMNEYYINDKVSEAKDITKFVYQFLRHHAADGYAIREFPYFIGGELDVNNFQEVINNVFVGFDISKTKGVTEVTKADNAKAILSQLAIRKENQAYILPKYILVEIPQGRDQTTGKQLPTLKTLIGLANVDENGNAKTNEENIMDEVVAYPGAQIAYWVEDALGIPGQVVEYSASAKYFENGAGSKNIYNFDSETSDTDIVNASQAENTVERLDDEQVPVEPDINLEEKAQIDTNDNGFGTNTSWSITPDIPFDEQVSSERIKNIKEQLGDSNFKDFIAGMKYIIASDAIYGDQNHSSKEDVKDFVKKYGVDALKFSLIGEITSQFDNANELKTIFENNDKNNRVYKYFSEMRDFYGSLSKDVLKGIC